MFKQQQQQEFRLQIFMSYLFDLKFSYFCFVLFKVIKEKYIYFNNFFCSKIIS